jgi:Cu+-exporting ATPase
MEAAKSREISPRTVEGFESVTGKGIVGRFNGKRVGLGSIALAAELAPQALEIAGTDVVILGDVGQTPTSAESLRKQGQTIVVVVEDDRILGVLGIADPIKASAADAIRSLHDEGVQVVMLTGDHRTTAEAVAKELGIDDVMAQVLPMQKLERIAELQGRGRTVAMAGDGINDAPALAKAHVGIAMGTGTDVAIESAGITLLKGDLRALVRARRLSQATMRNIRQNLFFAFVYNVLGVPIAAGVLYPFFGLLLSPMLASAAMSASSVSVIANALRLRRASL